MQQRFGRVISAVGKSGIRVGRPSKAAPNSSGARGASEVQAVYVSDAKIRSECA